MFQNNKLNVLSGVSSYIVFFACLLFLLFSCKTKKVPIVPLVESPSVLERTFVIQVCDKFQMSYDGLPCVVHFSDGTTMQYTTKVDGKIIVKIKGSEINIEKVEYDFAHYKQRGGQLLAKEDFKLATCIASAPQVRYVVVESMFSSETKNLFVLAR